MKDIIKSLKSLILTQKEPSTSELFKKMDDILEQAEQDVGGNFFPKDATLTTEQVHYLTLNLKEGADFEHIKEKYLELKNKYPLSNEYEGKEEQYKEILEINTKLDIAYTYFKKKFSID